MLMILSGLDSFMLHLASRQMQLGSEWPEQPGWGGKRVSGECGGLSTCTVGKGAVGRPDTTANKKILLGHLYARILGLDSHFNPRQ